MPKLTIDGIEITVDDGTSLLQAAEQLGIEVPRFCYHDRLSVAGNCRMCLMEVEGAPKLAASCAQPCADGMKVHTKSDKVKKAQKGVMEMMLINHPLDCPICDQGGECDLQDQAVAYGYDRGRFIDKKRAVKNKNISPLIRTTMTRCIHCTRCVRFCEEVAGVFKLGLLNRGDHLEIGTYVENMIDSELSGNLVDVCPVGALTSRPYAFKARPWELTKTYSIDVMDAVGSNIRIDSRGNKVMRILPRLHEDINEEWISDKTRYACDGLQHSRLDRPYLKNAKGKLEEVSWDTALEAVADKLREVDGKHSAAIVGDLCDAEAIMALKDLMVSIGSPNLECRNDGAKFDVSEPVGYTFNSGIAGIEDADAILLIGTNPRWEAAILNSRIYRNWKNNNTKIAVVGPKIDLNYHYEHLGNSADILQDVLDGDHHFSEILKNAKKPALILGVGATIRKDGLAIHKLARDIADKYNLMHDNWKGFNMLQNAASRMAALMLGFVPNRANGGMDLEEIIKASTKGKLNFLYLLNVDNIAFDKLGKNTFIVYQGHHGDSGAAIADVVLPAATYTEKYGTYVNLEGRVQHTKQAVAPVGKAKEDWRILRSLSAHLGRPLPYDNLTELRDRMIHENELFKYKDQLPSHRWCNFARTSDKVTKTPFKLPISDFYNTNVICYLSKIMQECSEIFVKKTIKKKKVNG